jgi:hypothetical protein
MITFNGDQFFERILAYGTLGDFFVMQAKQTVAGSSGRVSEPVYRFVSGGAIQYDGDVLTRGWGRKTTLHHGGTVVRASA